MEKKTVHYIKAAMTQEAFFYAYKELAATEDRHLLLESGRSGSYCMAGLNPLVTLQALEGNQLKLTWRNGNEEVQEGEPLDLLSAFVETYALETVAELPDYQGGVMGFISYDYVRRYESIPSIAKNDLVTPDIYFYLFDQWAVLDREKETVYFMALPDKAHALEAWKQQWFSASEKGMARKTTYSTAAAFDLAASDKIEVSVTGPQFEQMVRDVQRYIAEGDVVQVNLSVRQSEQLRTTPLAMYEALRVLNPSPYMVSMGAPDFAVVSGSPEMLLKKRGHEISTRPIGGTRRRGATGEEDQALYEELLSNEKEKGEHIMLVDLERKDFERVCVPDSVETNEFMVIEKYSHVMHLVSNVRGTVREDLSNAAIIRGVFPGGSITGDPKLRTMEIIEELEPTRRGLYTGSMGWIGFNGDVELNIVIRTAFIQHNRAYIQAGAGLVPDSDPTAEYMESLNKAKALWQAKEMAERG